MPVFQDPGPPREGGFTSTPRGDPPVAPRDPEKGFFPGIPGKGQKRAFLGLLARNPRKSGFSASQAPEGPGDPRREPRGPPGDPSRGPWLPGSGDPKGEGTPAPYRGGYPSA